ncbi:DsbA family protein [Nannocystis punicea]|uniref:Thioredoxin domain-containing protein n=1 Tax=Nannocystis punicea TaxID=2995304 RepID=A0ABY7H7V5_9BACT|nr:thioredoxin domain-containing protein [Nannocystis poenicansa]WAS95355.1 thioredoxin domain-containing protein [Nannocystis poenicansa]
MSTLKPSLGPRDHLRGELSRPIHLVEFGDFECPFCGQAQIVVHALERALGDQLCVGFRNFPIVGAHPHAQLAAEAAEAAGAQGRYWQMHELLFENQHALEIPHLDLYAEQVGLDMRRFAADLDDHRHLEKIRSDLHSGAISGVAGTPTFFINGIRHEGPFDFDSLLAAMTLAARFPRAG